MSSHSSFMQTLLNATAYCMWIVVVNLHFRLLGNRLADLCDSNLYFTTRNYLNAYLLDLFIIV